MFEVDSCAAILADDDLELVVPAVCACPNLNTLYDLTSPTQHIATKFRARLGFCVVQTQQEQSRVHSVEAFCVVRVLFASQNIPESRPDLPILRTQNPQGTLGSVLDWSLPSIVHDNL